MDMKDNPFRQNAAGVPEPAGLYDPKNDHDSCGVGFVARIDGVSLHLVVQQGIQVLVNLEHRGALGGDKATGDGSGIMVGIPDIFFRQVCPGDGLYLPPAGRLRRRDDLPADGRSARREMLGTYRMDSGKRRLPGPRLARGARRPLHPRRPFRLHPPADPPAFPCPGKTSGEAFERKLYAVRRLTEKEIASWNDVDASQFYVVSLSSRTIVYKGLLTGTQLPQFYPDLMNELFMSPFAVVHQRYSTNTLPTWHLAQPFRICAHNGEINTLRGNINRMRAREATLLLSPVRRRPAEDPARDHTRAAAIPPSSTTSSNCS